MTGVSHVLSIVADDRRHTADLLDNVSEVVNDKGQRRAALRNRPEQAVHLAHYIVEDACDVVEGVDQERVEIEGLEDAIDNVDKMAFNNSSVIPTTLASDE